MIEDGFLAADLAHRRRRSPTLRAVSPRPDAAAPDHAARRPPADRGAAAAGVPRAGPQVRRGPVRRRRRRRRPRTCSTAGSRCWPGWPTTRCCCAGELDWVAKLRLLEGYRDRDGLGWATPGCSWSTCSTPTCGRTRACTTGWSRRGRMERLVDRRARSTPGDDRAAGGHPGLLPRPVPAPVRRRRSRPRPGTRSSSTSRAASRCSGSRPWSRCAAPRRTSATCSTAARPPTSWSPRSPAG